jgi:hypothetical protein
VTHSKRKTNRWIAGRGHQGIHAASILLKSKKNPEAARRPGGPLRIESRFLLSIVIDPAS